MKNQVDYKKITFTDRNTHSGFTSFIDTGTSGSLRLPHNDLYKRSKLLRWYGIDRENNSKDFRCEADIPEWGFKFHMNDVNATIGMENLNYVDDIINKHISGKPWMPSDGNPIMKLFNTMSPFPIYWTDKGDYVK